MTSAAHTLYSVSLFLALQSLLLWSKRRHRSAFRYRRALANLINAQ
jgi:hypothetical protein